MRGAIVLLAGLALAAPATAAPLQVTAAATPPQAAHYGAASARVDADGGFRARILAPMWIAPSLDRAHGQGTTVVVRL